MAKAYWVVCYRSISDPAARDAYTKVPAVLASGGQFLARGLPAKTYEGGIDAHRTGRVRQPRPGDRWS